MPWCENWGYFLCSSVLDDISCFETSLQYSKGNTLCFKVNCQVKLFKHNFFRKSFKIQKYIT